MAVSTIIYDDRLDYFSRRNLLDNWYFIGGGSQKGNGIFPINQRQQTSYSPGYGLDRWSCATSLTLTIGNDYITVNNSDTSARHAFAQRIEGFDRLVGHTVTCSLLKSDGSLISGSSVVPASGSVDPTSFDGHSFRLEGATSSNTLTFTIMIKANSSLSIKAIKLELGSTQTLAHQENGAWVLNELPNFKDQLLKCQRWFVDFNPYNETYPDLGVVQFENATNVYPFFILPTTMRAVPTVSYTGSYVLRRGTTNTSISSISINMFLGNAIKLRVQSSGLTDGSYILMGLNNAHLRLSAEI